jgi:hypothetical protein
LAISKNTVVTTDKYELTVRIKPIHEHYRGIRWADSLPICYGTTVVTVGKSVKIRIFKVERVRPHMRLSLRQ